MKNMWINDRQHNLPEMAQTLGDVLDFAASNWVPAGEVITRVTVDGQELPFEEEADNRTGFLGEISDLRLWTERPRDVAYEGISEAIRYLPRLVEGSSRIAMLLRVGDLREAHDLLERALGGLDWFLSLLKFGLEQWPGIWQLSLAPRGEDFSVESAYNKLQALVPLLNDRMQQEQWIFFASLVEMELIPQLNRWTNQYLPVLLNNISRDN